jgi:hypothetical protein
MHVGTVVNRYRASPWTKNCMVKLTMATADEIELVKVAEHVLQTLPDGRFTLQAFMPVVTMLVEHADDMTHLTGPQKKTLVLRALHAAVMRLPPPENAVASMLLTKLGSQAVDALVAVSREAQVRFTRTCLFPNKPLVGQPARRPPGTRELSNTRRGLNRFLPFWRPKAPPRSMLSPQAHGRCRGVVNV